MPYCKCGNLFKDGATAYCVKCGFETRASADSGHGTLSDDALRSPGERQAWAALPKVLWLAGSVWAPPYRADLTGLLREGANAIRIDVYNTAINRLAEGGHGREGEDGEGGK